MSQKWAHQARGKEKPSDKIKLPERYQEFKDVFDDQKAERFPPTRDKDMKIEL